MSLRSSRTSYSNVVSDEIDFVSRSGSTARVSMPRARSRTLRPPGSEDRSRRASSSVAICPIVVMPNVSNRAAVFGPTPQRRARRQRCKKAASSPGAIASNPSGLQLSDAIFATIFPVATPALTVRPVLLANFRANRRRANAARFIERHVTKIDERFVEREPLNRMSARAKDREDLARDRFVALHVGRNDDELRAQLERAVEWDRRAHAEGRASYDAVKHDRAAMAPGYATGLPRKLGSSRTATLA